MKCVVDIERKLSEDWAYVLVDGDGGTALDSALLHSRQAVMSPSWSRQSALSPTASERYLRIVDSGRLGAGQTIFNIANVVMGVGVLSVPYALKQSGYCALALLMVVIYVTSTTARWIGEALSEVSKREEVKGVANGARDFGFMAHLLCGSRGKAIIDAVVVLEVWLALVTFMVMNGTNAALLWPSVPTAVAGPVMGAVATLFCLIPQDVFAYLSLFSTLSMFAGAAALLTASYQLSYWAEPYETFGWQAVVQVENIPRSLGIITFCFAGHPCFPAIATSMTAPAAWGRCVDVSFLLAALYYVAFGLLGFIVFGFDLSPSVATNLSDIKNAVLYREAAAYCFLVKVQLTVPLLMSAVMSAVWPPQVGAPAWPAGRVALLFLIGAVTSGAAVLLADALAVIASLAGSSCIMITSVLYPAALKWGLTQPSPGVGTIAHYANLLLVTVFGVVTAVSGTWLAVTDLLSGAR